MRRYIVILSLCITSACAAPETLYCDSLGVHQGSAEYPKCTGYYFQQQAEFGNARAACEAEADKTYPPTLYSQGTWAMGYDPWGHPEMVPIQPDWQQNHALDEIRMGRIVEPCMQALGWNSGRDWRAGHRAVSKAKRPPLLPPAQALPWLNK